MHQTDRLWADEPGPGWRRYLIADVFTATPLEGNPLAVFPDGRGLGVDVMQRTARELNLSETVFFLPAEHPADVRVRIFTPADELSFAGHPVLGSAFVLAEALGTSALTLETGAGLVPVELERNHGRVAFGRMEQPVPVPEPYEETEALLAALGVPRSGLPVEAYRNGPRHVYVEPSTGCPAKVSSSAGVKIRTRTSAGCSAGRKNTVSDRFSSRAVRCITSTPRPRPSGNTASGLPSSGVAVKTSAMR